MIDPSTLAVTRTIALPRALAAVRDRVRSRRGARLRRARRDRPAPEARRDQLRPGRQRRASARIHGTSSIAADGARVRLALHHASAARREHRGRADHRRRPTTAARWCVVDSAYAERGAHDRAPAQRQARLREPGPRHPELSGRGGDLARRDPGLGALQAGQHQARRAARRHRAELPEHRARDQLAHRPRQRAPKTTRRASTTTTPAWRAPAIFDQHGVYLFVALETSREVAVVDAHTAARSCSASTSAARRRASRSRPTASGCTSTTSWTARSACSTWHRCCNTGAVNVPLLATLAGRRPPRS